MKFSIFFSCFACISFLLFTASCNNNANENSSTTAQDLVSKANELGEDVKSKMDDTVSSMLDDNQSVLPSSDLTDVPILNDSSFS